MTIPLRVVIIADSRFPICEPFAGGMQSMTWHLVDGLRRRGVEVSVFAGAGTDRRLPARQLPLKPLDLSPAARNDVSMEPVEWLEQHHAYLQVMLRLARDGQANVVHNNSLHYLPVAMAETLSVPVVTTLHTPPTPWLEPAIGMCDQRRNQFVAVSEHTARSWSHVATPRVIHNGIDARQWSLGSGGSDLVWFGRLVPEKAPHLAIDIARAAGRTIRLAGPISDTGYWDEQVRPRLGRNAVYVGHLNQRDLTALVGRSSVALVTPLWDEPYGLVAAEALACGTPVVGFDRGGLSEVLSPSCARLVEGGDIEAAAVAVRDVEHFDRRAARGHALEHCSLDVMLDRYLGLYRELSMVPAA